MGYTTDFHGRFNLDKELTNKHYNYLKKFSNTRRMARDSHMCSLLRDKERLNVHLLAGIDGEYFVGGDGLYGQDSDESIVDYNSPPSTQPSIWCQWVPSKDKLSIEWNGGEKFYCYVEWINYLIDNFLKPWGYTLNGTVSWKGEDPSDIGDIVINNNKIKIELY